MYVTFESMYIQMILIEHRVNTLSQLRQVPVNRGIEIDIRDYNGQLCLAHDPFESGEKLDDLLAEFMHAFIIFNVKCDGLEEAIIDLANQYNIEKYFFLDSALPSLVKLSRKGINNFAVRVSEYEPIELAMRFAGLVDWVWVDCFHDFPLTTDTYLELKKHFKLCLVSPEMQNHSDAHFLAFTKNLRAMPFDAVCSDRCDDWGHYSVG